MSSQKRAYIPIVLSAKKVQWRDEGEYERDAEFQRTKQAILSRDDFGCRFCGFRALSYQEVHHLNDDHRDHSPENLATACAYCHMCQHIGLAGARGEAALIWLPEMEQVELNHLVRAIQVALHWKETGSAQPGLQRMNADPSAEFADMAISMFDLLKSRRDEAKVRLGTDAPETLANVLLRMNDEQYSRRSDFLVGVRLLPLGVRVAESRDIMPEMVKAWVTGGGQFTGMKPPSWNTMLRSRMEELRGG